MRIHRKHLVVIPHIVVNKGWLLTTATTPVLSLSIVETSPEVDTGTHGHLLD